MKTIVFSRLAFKQLVALPLATQEAIETALDAYALEGRGDVKALEASRLSRLRVGRYRVIFAEDGVTILAIEITKRDHHDIQGNDASMSDPIVINTPSGDHLVILTRADYDAMVARLVEYEAAEDAADAAAGTKAVAAWEAQGRPAYPLPVVRLMRDGFSPLAAFRRHKKLTKKALAREAGIGLTVLDELEKGGRAPSPQNLAALALALGTNEASLEPFDAA